EPLGLLKRLGELTSASLTDNARAAGLSGRGAATLDLLFSRAWRYWRASGVLATPAPDSAPIDARVIASLVRAAPAPPQTPRADGPRPSGIERARALLVHREADGKLDEKGFLDALGVAAGVFEHAPIRVTVKAGGSVDAGRTKKIIDAAEGRFDI